MMKRLGTLFLALLMVLTMMPAGAFSAIPVFAAEAAGPLDEPVIGQGEEMAADISEVSCGEAAEVSYGEAVAAQNEEPAEPLAAIEVKYQEKGANIFELGGSTVVSTNYNLYCTLPEEVQSNWGAYTFRVETPDGQSEEYTSETGVRLAGKGVIYALWEYHPKKPGSYTVTIKETDADKPVAQGTVEIVQLTFNTVDGGAFDGGNTTYTAYYRKPKDKYSVYFDRQALVPAVISNGENSFIGWSAESGGQGALVNYADLYALTSKSDDGVYNVYAVYGKKKTYGLQMKDAKESIEIGQQIAFSVPAGESVAKTLTLKNIGNQNLTISLVSVPDFLTIDFQDSTGASKGTRTITINAEEEVSVVFTLKKDLTPGDHTGYLGFMTQEQRTYYNYAVKVSVLSGTLIVTPEAVTKKYGQTLTADNIGVTIKYEGTDTVYGGRLSDLGVTLSSDGFHKDAEVGKYSYKLPTTSTNPAYTVRLAEKIPDVTVEQDTPVWSSLEAGSVHVGNNLSASVLVGTFVNSSDSTMNVPGRLEWVNPDKSVGDTEKDIEEEWKFTPNDTKNYKETGGTVKVTVSRKESTSLELAPGCAQSVTYDGKPHAMTYTSDRTDDDTPILVRYRSVNGTDEDWTDAAPVGAGTYEVESSIAESAKYAPAVRTDTLTIEQRTVSFLPFEVSNKPYDGTTAATLTYYSINTGINNGDGIKAQVTAEFESPDAKPQAKVIIKVTGLTGDKANNYKLPDNPVYHTWAIIFPKKLTIKPVGPEYFTKEYGQMLYLTADDFEIEGLVPGNDAGFEFLSEGELSDADVNAEGYSVTARLTNTNYTFGGNGVVSKTTIECGNIKVTRARPVVNGSISVGAGRKGCELDHVALTGGFVNPNNSKMPVSGTLEWKEKGVRLPDNADSYEAAWVFTPTDSNNYEQVEGTVVITLLDKEPVHITVTGETEVTYDGEPHGLDAEVDPETGYTVEYRIQQMPDTQSSQGSADADAYEDWSTQEPTDAGTYDVRITADEVGEYAANQVIASLIISPVTPDNAAPKELTVPQGTALSSETVENAFVGCFTFKNEPVDGVLTWVRSDGVVNEDDLEFAWAFAPFSGNFTIVSGSTRFVLADDSRTVSADIYNLPAALNYKDYAVVDIGKSALKEGDEITFFKDGTNKDGIDEPHSDPVSDGVIITAEDIANGRLTIILDEDALTPDKDGTLYVRITSSKKNPVTELSYTAEPGFTLEDNGGANESILVTGNAVTKVWVTLLNKHYELLSVDFTLMDTAGIIALADGEDIYSCRLEGQKRGSDAVLSATVTFRHPDPARSDEVISFTLSRPVICAGIMDAGTESGDGAPNVTLDEQEMVEALITDEDREALAENKSISYKLHVENQKDAEVSETEKTAIGNALAALAGNDSYTVGQYLDITLTRSVDDAEMSEIHKTSGPLTITIQILQSLMEEAQKISREPQFVVVRLHDGEAEILPDQDSDPNTITIVTDSFSTYAIAYRRTGDLTVSLSVTGNAGETEKEFTFTVTLGDSTINGVYGDMEFTDGKAAFGLKNGESRTAKGLPAGVSYTVEETGQEGYETTGTGTKGIITADKESTAVFENHKESVVDPEPSEPEDKEDPDEGDDDDESYNEPEESTDPTESVEAENQPEADNRSLLISPPTNDNNHLGLWLGLFAFALVITIVLTVEVARKRRQK